MKLRCPLCQIELEEELGDHLVDCPDRPPSYSEQALRAMTFSDLEELANDPMTDAVTRKQIEREKRMRREDDLAAWDPKYR